MRPKTSPPSVGTETTSLRLATELTPGPALRHLQRRSLALWIAAATIGSIPALFDGSPFWSATGIGLWFPGAGFLYDGLWYVTIGVVLAFGVSLLAWILVGGFVFPVAVWLGSALAAGAFADESPWVEARWVAPLTVATAFVAYFAYTQWSLRSRRAVEQELQAHLAKTPYVEPTPAVRQVRELSDDDLACARYVLDRALQPLHEFSGFTTIDQFREAAWRYQLVTMNYALAALQANSLPAFRGYLHEAQSNSILKMLDRRAWHYWRVENFLGNLKFSADPVKSENVMLSGWWALALGAYERATGDHRFSEPHSLTFRESAKRSYPYDYPQLVKLIGDQFDDRDICFFPCEPNWAFTTCNLYAMAGTLLHDQEHGTSHGRERLAKFSSVLEREFTTSDGRSVMIASRRTGLRAVVASPVLLTSVTWLVNMVDPRIAQSYWAIARRTLSRESGGRLEDYTPSAFDATDPGNYRLTKTFLWANMMLGAAELDDREVYDIAAARLDENGYRDEDGVRTYTGSNFANLAAHLARFSEAGTWHRFAWGDVHSATRTGPYLDTADYPRVLVAKATNDGRALEMVLVPGAGRVETDLDFGGLAPGQRYRLHGPGADKSVVADSMGRASAPVTVHSRMSLSLSPSL